jgi:hypothetical protein
VRIAAALFVLACAFAQGARAEYVVLRSGVRLHITGYELDGTMVRLHVNGGIVDVAAYDVLTIEPEEVFALNKAPTQTLDVPYSELIRIAAAKYGLDPLLVASVAAAESNFNPRAISVKNAQGLMQLMPETSLRLGVSNPFDPAQSINAGARYLRELLDRFHGELRLALAAYNAGPERVDQYQGVPPYRETLDYVRRVTQSLPPTQTSPNSGKLGPTKKPLSKSPAQTPQIAHAKLKPNR